MGPKFKKRGMQKEHPAKKGPKRGRVSCPFLIASTCLGYFFRGPPCHTYTHFFGIVIIVGRGNMLQLRLSQGISSGCHHATHTPNFFLNCHYCGKGHYVSASTKPRYFFSVPPCYPYNKFFWNCHYYGKGHYDSAST